MDSVENLESFVNALLDGILKPYLKSEPLPDSNDEPVKVLRKCSVSLSGIVVLKLLLLSNSNFCMLLYKYDF